MKSPGMYFPNGFDMQQAVLCTQLVATAYDMYAQWKIQKDPDPKKFNWRPKGPTSFTYGKPIWGTSGALLWKDTEPFAFVATDTKTVYVVFRGTQSGANWLSNLDADLVRYKPVANYGKVHEGFYDLYMSMRKSLLKCLNDYGDIGKLVICGHSLGSALSTLAVPDVLINCTAVKNKTKVVHYNLASPRVANPGFADTYNGNAVQTFRIVNTEDVVTNVPLSVMGSELFQHVGVPVDFSAQYGSMEANHNSDTAYLYALNHPDDPEK